MVIVLFLTVFKRQSKANEGYLREIKSFDSVIAYQKKTIESLEEYNHQLDLAIQALDSAYKNNRPIETRIITKYEKVPVDVRNLDREQLRREVSNY